MESAYLRCGALVRVASQIRGYTDPHNQLLAVMNPRIFTLISVMILSVGCAGSLDQSLIGHWQLRGVTFPDSLNAMDGRTLIESDAIRSGQISMTYAFESDAGTMLLEEANGYQHPEYYQLSSSGNRLHFKESYFGTEYTLAYDIREDGSLELRWPDEMVMVLTRAPKPSTDR